MKVKDQFANLAVISGTQSGTNATTSTELVTGISLGQGVGFLIDQIDYFPNLSTLALLTTSEDYFDMTLGTQTEEIGADNSRVLDTKRVCRLDLGTAASGLLFELPLTKIFSPSLIVATPRLFFTLSSSGLASAGGAVIRMYYRYIELTSAEYLELAETFVLVG